MQNSCGYIKIHPAIWHMKWDNETLWGQKLYLNTEKNLIGYLKLCPEIKMHNQ